MAFTQLDQLQFVQRAYRRQWKPSWNKHYTPVVKACVREAPGLSWAATVFSPLVGREIHALSRGELAALCLALYHPRLVDIHEQRALWAEATQHPLKGSPFDPNKPLDGLPGMIAVAERLGYLKRLPRGRFADPEASGGTRQAIVPFCGDFLLFLRDKLTGEAFCVNWSVKPYANDFKRPAIGTLKRRLSQAAATSHMMRHVLEREYYLGAGIQTKQVAATDIPAQLAANLRALMATPVGRHDHIQTEASADLRMRLLEAQRSSKPPLECFTESIWRYRVTLDFCVRTFHRLIRERELSVDLYSPILADKPMRPADRDPIDQFKSWFEA